MKVVIDSNVFVSALAKRSGVTNQIYSAWRGARFDLVISEHQIGELRRISRYPQIKALVPGHVFGALIRTMRHRNVLVLPVLPGFDELEDMAVLKDRDDFFLVAMAMAGNADYLVTGDKKSGLLELGSIGRTVVLTPSSFCARCL